MHCGLNCDLLITKKTIWASIIWRITRLRNLAGGIKNWKCLAVWSITSLLPKITGWSRMPFNDDLKREQKQAPSETLATGAAAPRRMEPAAPITAKQHRSITKPSLVKDLLFKERIFKGAEPFNANPFKDLWLCSQVSAAKLLLVSFAETQRSTVQKKDSPPFSLTVLSPQVTFLCSLSPETITLPRSPDAHQHTEQMRRQSWETGRLQSDTSQVWLCGYVRLPPPLLWVVWGVPEELSEDWEGSGFSWTKGGSWEQHSCIK